MKPSIEAKTEIFSISQERLQAFKMAEKMGFFRHFLNKIFSKNHFEPMFLTKNCNIFANFSENVSFNQ